MPGQLKRILLMVRLARRRLQASCLVREFRALLLPQSVTRGAMRRRDFLLICSGVTADE